MSDPDENVCDKQPGPSGRHCWHHSPEQHAVHVAHGTHRDEVCCFCSKKRCRTIMHFDPEKHGQFAP